MAQLLCPIMSSGSTGVPCVQDKCALWDRIYDQCSYASAALRVVAALDHLNTTAMDIKSRL